MINSKTVSSVTLTPHQGQKETDVVSLENQSGATVILDKEPLTNNPVTNNSIKKNTPLYGVERKDGEESVEGKNGEQIKKIDGEPKEKNIAPEKKGYGQNKLVQLTENQYASFRAFCGDQVADSLINTLDQSKKLGRKAREDNDYEILTRWYSVRQSLRTEPD